MKYDVIIIGAGLVGLSTAYQLKSKKPNSKILVLEKGKLIESGTHEELMQNNGIYFELNQSHH